MGPASLDILFPEQSTDELNKLTTALRGDPDFKVTITPALILDLTPTAGPPPASDQDPRSFTEMGDLSAMSVPAHDLIRDGEGLVVRAKDPRLNDVIADDLDDLANGGPFKLARLPDGATRVTDDSNLPPTDEALLTTVKRRVADLHLTAADVHLASAGRVEVDFGSAGDAETFGHADLRHTVFELRLEAKSKSDVENADRFDDRGDVLWLEKQPIATDSDVVGVFAVNDAFNRPAIGFKFGRDGAARLDAATTASIGRRLGVVVDGKLLNAPRIDTPIGNGAGVISGDFTEDQARALAKEIKDAAGTVPLKVLEVHTGS